MVHEFTTIPPTVVSISKFITQLISTISSPVGTLPSTHVSGELHDHPLGTEWIVATGDAYVYPVKKNIQYAKRLMLKRVYQLFLRKLVTKRFLNINME